MRKRELGPLEIRTLEDLVVQPTRFLSFHYFCTRLAFAADAALHPRGGPDESRRPRSRATP